ncbi:unnamed protein product [Brassica oleracea var. botrytis]
MHLNSSRRWNLSYKKTIDLRFYLRPSFAADYNDRTLAIMS